MPPPPSAEGHSKEYYVVRVAVCAGARGGAGGLKRRLKQRGQAAGKQVGCGRQAGCRLGQAGMLGGRQAGGRAVAHVMVS